MSEVCGGYGGGRAAAFVLVLYILLVIILAIGDTLFTIKVNNYWNSADMVKKYGVWNGQLWIALSCDQFEIELKRKAKAKRDTTQPTQEKRVI
ncbi:hypothetical protein [Paenibacillus aestuarii]|uniref:Uncharacterized protein n=1 Tax=Paenibacillus aestuarii TaxID=516965 RepID=A0ABW0K6M9_9BACL|nr:hypothetical protein [Paenibacillus aestuarii]